MPILSEDRTICSSLYNVSAVYTWNCILSLHTVVSIVSIREGLKGDIAGSISAEYGFTHLSSPSLSLGGYQQPNVYV